MRRIAAGAYVHVAGTVYGPGDVPTEAHAALIRNPAAWEDDEAAATTPAPSSTPAKVPAKAARKAADSKEG